MCVRGVYVCVCYSRWVSKLCVCVRECRDKGSGFCLSLRFEHLKHFIYFIGCYPNLTNKGR